MITTLLFDFSNTLFFAKDSHYQGGLNNLHSSLKSTPGYNLFNYFSFNQELLTYLSSLSSSFTLAVFTKGTIQNEPEIKRVLSPLFSYIFSAVLDFSGTKKDPAVYRQIASRLQVRPSNILFIDDNFGNLLAARTAGCATHQFHSNSVLVKLLSKLPLPRRAHKK